MKTIYTKQAEDELETFVLIQKAKLEENIIKDKSVFGDDLVEITAADIKRYGKKLNITSTKNSKLLRVNLVAYAYVVIGFLLSLTGLFYNQIKTIFQNSTEQALMFTMGISMAFVGLFFRQYIFMREKTRHLENEIFVNELSDEFVDRIREDVNFSKFD